VLAGEADSDRRKEVLGNVSPYEILLLLDPELPEERQTELVSRVRELVERGGGTWQNHELWGRRKLAYEIDHRADGYYHLLTFDVDAGTLEEISRVLKIADGVLRHLAVRRVQQARPSRPVAAVGTSRQDEGPPVSTAEEEGTNGR
jgi:small subunit ribosomal protein S6